MRNCYLSEPLLLALRSPSSILPPTPLLCPLFTDIFNCSLSQQKSQQPKQIKQPNNTHKHKHTVPSTTFNGHYLHLIPLHELLKPYSTNTPTSPLTFLFEVFTSSKVVFLKDSKKPLTF